MMDECEPTSEMHTGSNNAVHYDCAAQGIRKKKRGVESWFPEEVPEVEVDIFDD